MAPTGATSMSILRWQRSACAGRAAWKSSTPQMPTDLDCPRPGSPTRWADERHDATIISKFGVRWDEAEGRARTLARQQSGIPVTLRWRLAFADCELDRIPVYLVHWPDELTPVEEVLAVLDRTARAWQDRGLRVV